MIRIESLRARIWPITCVVLMLVFGASRLYDLRSRPIHHDEGVNGIFMKNLVQHNNWKYDPSNYHGPTLYYFHLIPTWINSYLNDGAGTLNRNSISGLTIVSFRLVVAIVGIFLLWVVLQSWPLLGRVGAAAACILAGLSCDMLFLSRYFIHEIYVVLFTYGTLLAGYRYRQTKDPLHAYVAAASATLLFCTKETAIFHLLILLLSYLCATVAFDLMSGRPISFSPKPLIEVPRATVLGLGRHAANIFAMCLVIWVTFFSSFFSNWRGPFDSLRAYFFWGAEGMESGHVKAFFYYFTDIMIRYETVVLIFGFVGLAAAFIRNERKGLFLSFWALGMAAFYSIIPYKTPWLVINLVMPLAILGGYGVQAVYDAVTESLPRAHARLALGAIAGFGLFLAAAEARQTIKVNYKEYDNDKHPQVYAHTIREVNDMMSKIDAVATRTSGKNIVINVFAEVYWPMPMYLMQYPNARFWGTNVSDSKDIDAPILIVAPKLQPEVDARIKDIYSIKTYTLRPSIPLALYVNTSASANQTVISRTLDLLAPQGLPKGAKPGMKLEMFNGVGFAGRPDRVMNGDTSYSFDWAGDGDKKYKTPFSLRWTGFIDIQKAGLYKFALESDDGSWLTIDDTPVIDNGGDHPVIKMSRNVNLSAGFHKVELKYFDVLGGAVLKFTWATPGGIEGPVPGTLFQYKP